jgi:hypothetical protein
MLQGCEIQWNSMTQTLHLEPIFYFFGGQTLNLKPITFFSGSLNLKPGTYYFFPD